MKTIKEKYYNFVKALDRAKIPCKTVLRAEKIVVECGWNYPERLFSKIDKIASTADLNTSHNVIVCAESSTNETILDSNRINGGPKRY